MKYEVYHIIKKPVVTEESQIQTAKANQYTFRVDAKANKIQIKRLSKKCFLGFM
jgi:large subunit ribosomal protein L23